MSLEKWMEIRLADPGEDVWVREDSRRVGVPALPLAPASGSRSQPHRALACFSSSPRLFVF